MTKIDVFSGFLGAGKTTLIKKLLKEAYAGEKLVLIENEFGEIGIDGGFMKDAGIQVTEMNQGCICCSLVGDFGKALAQVLEQFHPDRILIEPSGVGKLSDVLKAVMNVQSDDLVLNTYTTVVDASKIKMYMKNFGEFYKNQVETAKTIILSRSQKLSEDKLAEALAMIRQLNEHATIVTTPWDDINGKQILEAMEIKNSFAEELLKDEGICPVCGHHHDDDDDECDHDHEHHHHHDDDEDDHECCHHHHDHDDDEHEHHHDHDEDEHEHHHHDGECGCGHHHHHHGHDADEVFSNFGVETAKKFTREELENALSKLSGEEYGTVLRAKGIVAGADGVWYHFDFVPEEYEVRTGSADVTGRMCVIGAKLAEDKIKALFGV
ncbi:MAG TPA: cobalamin biosynthesis protein CobW [Ruminococcaceae bacterium]|nr:cobalamin biosynthesis protein CobW [Oscillospiraceae bacterium]